MTSSSRELELERKINQDISDKEAYAEGFKAGYKKGRFSYTLNEKEQELQRKCDFYRKRVSELEIDLLNERKKERAMPDYCKKDIKKIRKQYGPIFQSYSDEDIRHAYSEYCDYFHAASWCDVDMDKFIAWATTSPLCR